MELGIYFAAGKSGSAAGARRQKAKGVVKTDGSPTFAAFAGPNRENHKDAMHFVKSTRTISILG